MFNILNAFKKRRILIYIPRLDLVWKKNITAEFLFSQLTEEKNWENRIDWIQFTTLLSYYFKSKNYFVDIKYLPMYKIKQKQNLFYSKVFYPHQNKNMMFIRKNHYFYMQSNLKGLFSIDTQGWGASNANINNKVNCNKNYFSLIKNQIESGNYQSKFLQIKSNKIVSRKSNFDIFFPLQIPHDENLKLHCNYKQFFIFKKVVFWARKNKKKIVFKAHPQNISLFDNYLNYEDRKFIYFSNNSIDDLINSSNIIYTINSSVGFESLFYEKPVVTFGNSDYSMVTTVGNVYDLDNTYEKVLKLINNKILKINYGKFINNYFSNSFHVYLDRENIGKFDNIFKNLKI